jgi:uncharacterized YkwD family protein
MYRRSRGSGAASPWTAALIAGVIALGVGGVVAYNTNRRTTPAPSAYNAPITPYQNIAPGRGSLPAPGTTTPGTTTTPGVNTTPGTTTTTPGTTTPSATVTPGTAEPPPTNVQPPPSAPGGTNGSIRSSVPSYQQPTAAPPQPSAQPTSVAGQASMETEMVRLVNSVRAQAGLPALTPDANLNKIARLKSQDMINRNYFSHQSPTYGSPFDMLRSFGVTYRAAGENIALNQSTSAAHTALMNSTGHRANILGRQYTKVGIGIVKGSRGYYFTQIFTG